MKTNDETTELAAQAVDTTISAEAEEPARWRIARTILACFVVFKVVGHFRHTPDHAAGLDGFALGAFVVACAIGLMVEGVRRIVVARRGKA